MIEVPTAVKAILGLFTRLVDLLSVRTRLVREKEEEAYHQFKSMLSADVQKYECQDLTFSLLVVDLYPKHYQALRNLESLYPKGRVVKLKAIWAPYQEIYESRAQFGMFGGFMSELPHPDFGSSPEMASTVERKRRKQVVGVLRQALALL